MPIMQLYESVTNNVKTMVKDRVGGYISLGTSVCGKSAQTTFLMTSVALWMHASLNTTKSEKPAYVTNVVTYYWALNWYMTHTLWILSCLIFRYKMIIRWIWGWYVCNLLVCWWSGDNGETSTSMRHNESTNAWTNQLLTGSELPMGVLSDSQHSSTSDSHFSSDLARRRWRL